MRIEELSVGDWVQARMVKWDYEDLDITPPMRVVRIEKDCVRLGFSLDDLEFEVFIDDLQPIPIAAEVLERNGFEIVDEAVDFQLYGSPECSIFFTKGTVRYRLETPQASVVCWNVHQLQHALRLAGVEKEIKV